MTIGDDPRFSFQYRWFAQLTAQLWARYLLPRFTETYEQRPFNYIECGTCEAMSLIWSLEKLGSHGGLFVGIDPFLNSRHWHEDEGQRHKGIALQNISGWFESQPQPAADCWHWAKGAVACELQVEDSGKYLRREFRSFDLAYVDGNHNADQAVLDIVLMFAMLRDGGVLVVDDYDRKVRGGRPQVKPAVDAFEITHEGNFDVIYRHQKQVAFLKRPRRRRQFPPILEAGPVIAPTA